MTEAESPGKRVSWVELYFDLIFVFAVGQTTHTIVADPHAAGVGAAFGFFVSLWWTWIGYVVLYNRHGEDQPNRRLLVLAGTVPCAIAALELHASTAGFALALAGARLVLTIAYLVSADQTRPVAVRIAVGYAVATALFTASAFVESPWRYVIWAFALVQEAGFLLLNETRRAVRQKAAESGIRQQPDRAQRLRAYLQPPDDPSLRVDSAHLAERFGLFFIILLGEIVISVGSGAVGDHGRAAGYWAGLVAGLVLAAALWWIYFDSSAEINEFLLRTSGGNPAMAYGLYAAGHLGAAFALLVTAAGVSLGLTEHPPPAAAWLLTTGLALYLIGTRAIVRGRWRFGVLLRPLVVVAIVALALLRPWVQASGVIVIVAGCAVLAAAFVTRLGPLRLQRAADDPLSAFRD